MGMPFRRGAPSTLSLSLSLSQNAARIAFYDFLKEPPCLCIFQSLGHYFKQYVMVDTVEEFPYVAFEDKTRTSVIGTHFSDRVSQIQHSSMGAFADPAGKRGGDECRLEYGVQYLEYRMVENAISDARFVNMPQFRIAYPKWLVRPVSVGMMPEFPIQSKDFLFKLPLEPCHVWLVPFVALERIPRRENGIRPNY